MKKVIINNNNTEVSYDNLEIRYNEERKEFIFLEKYTDGNHQYLVDAINKGKIDGYDLEGFELFNKETILEKGKNYTPDELLEIYNIMSKSKVNFTFPKNNKESARKNRVKEHLEINDNTRFEYKDISILYSEEREEFYFLKIELDDMNNIILYDAISGVKVSKSEIDGFKQLEKSLILEERAYTAKELSEIYKYMSENKVNFTFPKSSQRNYKVPESIPSEIEVTNDTKYKYDDLEVRINYSTGSLYFLVNKVFKNKLGFDQIARYDAINGQNVSNSLLIDYEELPKELFFTVKRDYSAKEISTKYRLVHENGIIIPDQFNEASEKKSSK